MPIKLLKKNEIHAIQQREKRDEIEQGKQLASRIDRLREVAVQEEASLKRFRTETVARIYEEIDVENQKLIALKNEIRLLEEDRARGLTEIEQAKAVLSQKETEYNTRLKELTAKLDNVAVNAKIVLNSLKDAEAKMTRAIKLQEEAEQVYFTNIATQEQILIDKKTVENVKSKLDQYQERVQKELTERELNIASIERSLHNKQASLETREKAVGERERAVQDMYNALLQAQKHLKKHD